MDQREFRKLFADNYVVVQVDVQEHDPDKKEALENPGGVEQMTGFGGAQSGLPFYVIVDPTGKKLADSNAMPGGTNIGYPGTGQEIAAFAKLLRDTAPRITDDQIGRLTDYLQANAPH